MVFKMEKLRSGFTLFTLLHNVFFFTLTIFSDFVREKEFEMRSLTYSAKMYAGAQHIFV